MLHRMLAACLAAGLLAGLATAALQEFTTTPLIIKAEAYESGAPADGHGHGHGGHSHSGQQSSLGGDPQGKLGHPEVTMSATGDASHGSEASVWAPADGIERQAFTAVSTIALTFGFALMLLSAMLIAGAPITARSGLAWAAAAFVATGLAPALGLSPELPGSAAADLVDRQSWWFATAAATALGLYLALRVSSPIAIAAGLVLLVAPHVVGAPHPEGYTSGVPSEIAGHFSAASLVVHAAMWAMVGAIAGYVWQRGDEAAA
ncbi:MAG: cobalt transporter [Rhizobiales bacterium]|nr:cobalt transporter [Hyphomicrobiales bacterium]